jgi:hypothetical protein
MRAGSVSARGGVAIAATTAKPQTVERIVDAVAGMFGMAPTGEVYMQPAELGRFVDERA